MDEGTFLLQTAGQLGRSTVVASHDEATTKEIAGDGTHADAADADEVYG